MNHAPILIGLIGANIMKSLSPALHEDALAALGIRGHYHLMDVDRLPGRRLEHLFAGVKDLGFSGINVTFPFKQAVLPLLDEVSSDARQIGAVNTVKFSENGHATGYNTDRSGFRRSVEDTLGRDAIAGRRVVVVGGGGAGRAVIFALLDLGAAHVAVHDVDRQRATATVADVITAFGAGRCSFAAHIGDALVGAAGVVNATPVGMLGIPGNPVPMDAVRAEHFVVDVIYTPMETALIAAARRKGCRVLTGGGMCVQQAADSFRIFTGLEPDIPRATATFAKALAARDTALAEATAAPRYSGV